MSENEMDGKEEVVGNDVEAARIRFENERLTRRQALRKFGFTAGMTVFAALSVDDLARIAAKKLQETEMTKGIGDTLAQEFREAGVALANPVGGDPYAEYDAGARCADQIDCEGCCDNKRAARDKACKGDSACITKSRATWDTCMASCP